MDSDSLGPPAHTKQGVSADNAIGDTAAKAEPPQQALLEATGSLGKTKPLPHVRIGKLRLAKHMLAAMGIRYVMFRASWEMQRRLGLLKRNYPSPPFSPEAAPFISYADWQQQAKPFFFVSKATLNLQKQPSERLMAEAEKIHEGQIKLFSSQWTSLGTDWDWHTHPETDYEYPRRHWTEIADLSAKAGDIKYVWEKARFSFLYTLLRHDYHHNSDQHEFVFGQIKHFITHNALNIGPQYRCSQETSLRVLNWTFALYYYRGKPLPEADFASILHSIRWQMRHVRSAIDFSRISVRNNHAITETLALYLVGMLYPWLPEAAEWKAVGKRWFEEEIEYQIYADGTYLQFSMNYHRVVVQLLAWALQLAKTNGEDFSPIVNERAAATLQFLQSCQDPISGWLPNYGANDGALFFPLSQAHYRDYRPALAALAAALGQPYLYDTDTAREEAEWLGAIPSANTQTLKNNHSEKSGWQIFDIGGFAVLRSTLGLSMLRCGNHKDRPQQADNLHLDIWHKGRNIFRDAGTYKYNTDRATLGKFVGTAAHNTVSLQGMDQMLKGPRFIWLDWSQANGMQASSTDEYDVLKGSIQAYFYLADGGIAHTRTVRKHGAYPIWEIEDELSDTLGYAMQQHWWPIEGFSGFGSIVAKDEKGNILQPETSDGYYSSFYGKRQATEGISFSTPGRKIFTRIELHRDDWPTDHYPDHPLDEK